MFCIEPECDKPVENPETGRCSTHSRMYRKEIQKATAKPKEKKAIKQNSDKKLQEISEYTKQKKVFFSIPQNKICMVCGGSGADSIHHGAGKVGYWDDEAREEGITLLLDERFWIPIHSFQINPDLGTSCHNWVETHPKEAKERGLSFNRIK